MDWPDKITPRQRDFVTAFVGEARGHAGNAAKIAGYSDKSYGRELRTKPHVLEAIELYRGYLLESGTYAVVDPIRVHQEWIDILDDLETTRYEKITLLRDASRANGMFTDTVNIRDESHPMRRLVLVEQNAWDPDKESPEDYVERMIKIKESEKK